VPALFQAARELCSNQDFALSREWLETDGLGGYASSTIWGLNTRRYHGLLVAALQPPAGRAVLLSKLEATVLVNGHSFELATNQYPGLLHPTGYVNLQEFRLDPFPISTWEVDGIVLEQSLFLVQGESTLAVRYRLLQGDAATLQIRPLLAFRDYHSLAHQNGSWNPDVQSAPQQVSVRPYGSMPPLHFLHSTAEIQAAGDWYRNFEYVREQERGLDFQEDLYQPFDLQFAVTREQPADLIVSLNDGRSVSDYEPLRDAECKRRAQFASRVAHAASQFVVPRQNTRTVIAGYHWFTDWGRDTMISLPGLTLATGKLDTARAILQTFAGHVSEGMLPNRFPDAGEAPEYNTVDATLWFFEAVRAFAAASGDWSFVRSQFYPVLCDIIAWHVRGTRYGIRADSDGMLGCGAPGVQLTWMDAKVGDWVVTPREGKPVEIQALWFNAVSIALALAQRFHDTHAAEAFQAIQHRIQQNFLPLFWNEQAQCLFDVVNGSDKDASIRPNQLFAMSLTYPLIVGDQAAQVLDRVTRELLTPYGLRTLTPADPAYQGHYGGDQRSRDPAYHQGTVWPWLIGPYIDAYLRVHGGTVEAKQHCRGLLEPLLASLDEAGLGQVSEIYDGDAPHHPQGCIAQAWSVAELLRAFYQTNLDPQN
jgi:predicted glycogen debranching enzyme